MFSSLMVFSAILVQQHIQRGRYLDKLTAGATFTQFLFTKTVPNFVNIHLAIVNTLFKNFSGFSVSKYKIFIRNLKFITRPKTNFKLNIYYRVINTTFTRRLTSSQMRTVLWPFSQLQCGKKFLPSLVVVKSHLLNCFSKTS